MKYLVFILLLCLSIPLFAEEKPDLLAVDSAFVAGRYGDVELMALRILHGGSELTSDERARLNLTAGFSLIMLNRETEARTYFNGALDAVPDLQLDPVQVSPKFRMVFDQVKAARPKIQIADTTPPNPPINGGEADIGSAMDRRVKASSQFMNLLVPGAGQWQEGHQLRGVGWFALEAAAVGVLIWRVNEMQDSRADYLAESNASRIHNAYDAYNDDYRAAWAAGIGAGLLYLASQADLVWLKPKGGRSLSLEPSNQGVRLTLAW